jgi:hypothetical protein
MEDRDIEIEKRKTVDDMRLEETAHVAAMAKEPRQEDDVGHAGCARNASEAASRTAYLENASILNTIERHRPRSIWLATCTCTHTHAPRTHTFTSPSDQGPSEKPGNGPADCDYLALLLAATVSESRSPES